MRLLAAGLALAWGLRAVPAEAASVHDHWDLTREILTELGWTDPAAIRAVAECNVCADLARPQAPLRELVRLAVPRSSLRMEPVMTLAATAPFNHRAADGFHFNSLYSFSDIAERWEDLGAWARATRATLETLSPGAERTEARAVFLGLLMHAVHDFYVHANWVEILDQYGPGNLDPGDFPTWEELVEDEGDWRAEHPAVDVDQALARMRLSDRFRSDQVDLGGLQTGRIRFEEISGAPLPWRHRHAGGDVEEVVEALARRAVTRWVREYGTAPAAILAAGETADPGSPTTEN